MGRLSDQLRARRPDLRLDRPPADDAASEPLGRRRRDRRRCEELADLDELEQTLGAGLPRRRASSDVDEEAVRRALGRSAVDDLDALRRIERELERAGLPAAAPTAGSS